MYESPGTLDKPNEYRITDIDPKKLQIGVQIAERFIQENDRVLRECDHPYDYACSAEGDISQFNSRLKQKYGPTAIPVDSDRWKLLNIIEEGQKAGKNGYWELEKYIYRTKVDAEAHSKPPTGLGYSALPSNILESLSKTSSTIWSNKGKVALMVGLVLANCGCITHENPHVQSGEDHHVNYTNVLLPIDFPLEKINYPDVHIIEGNYTIDGKEYMLNSESFSFPTRVLWHNETHKILVSSPHFDKLVGVDGELYGNITIKCEPLWGSKKKILASDGSGILEDYYTADDYYIQEVDGYQQIEFRNGYILGKDGSRIYILDQYGRPISQGYAEITFTPGNIIGSIGSQDYNVDLHV